MKEFVHIIADPEGIHARPAGMLLKEATKYSAKITLDKDGKQGDAKRIFAIMALGAKRGDTLKVTVEGEDEEEAAAALEIFLKENL